MKWYWWLALILAAYVIGRLNGCNVKCPEITIRHDTVWVDNPVKVVVDSAPIAVAVRPKKRAVMPIIINDTIVITEPSPCDSVRSYIHQAGDSLVDITVESEVEGVELFNKITYKHRYPVITNTEVVHHVMPRDVMLYGIASGSLSTRPDVMIGGGLFVKRFGFQYQYAPFTRSHQVGVGYRIY